MSSESSIIARGGLSETPHPLVTSGSKCCHLRPEEAPQHHQRTITRADSYRRNLFALIIGINEYKDEKIRNLRGSVDDSENVCRFLTQSLHANPYHIKHLRNAEATREGILSAFKEHLINNEKILHNDAIIFYFAGHGSYEILEEDLSGHKMETMSPCDDRIGARGIPDRTFDSLMRQLASKKGDNITAIFDSCHSGGMGRNPDAENTRSLPPPDSPFPLGLDDDILATDITATRLFTKVHDPYAPYPPLQSHVLLAACQHDELAHEIPLTPGSYSGAFTALLLDLLRQSERDLSQTTYIGLIHAFEQSENKSRLQYQTPYVEGDHKTRFLFTTTSAGRRFRVTLGKDGTFLVAAGIVHGIDKETEFAITSGKDYFRDFKPSNVMALSCTFKQPIGMVLRDDSSAEVVKWSRPHLKVFIHQSPNARPDSSPDYLAADVAIRPLNNGCLELERRDPLLPRYAQRFITISSRDASWKHFKPNTLEHTSVIIDGISRFNFQLLRQGSSNTIGDKLKVRLERLPMGGKNPRPLENGTDYFRSVEHPSPYSLADIKTGPKVKAAVTIPDSDLYSLFCLTISIRGFATPLFPYVFAFDASTYEIACFYHPEPTKDGPLHETQPDVTIGYGPHGGDPFRFQKNELTFFKVLVTSKYVDMQSLVQESPLSQADSRGARVIPVIFDFWESSWTYVVKS